MCPQATGRSARAWMSRTLKLTAAAVAPIVLSLEFVMALQSTRLLIVLLPRLRIKTAISYVHYCTLQIESIVIVASANRKTFATNYFTKTGLGQIRWQGETRQL